MIEVTKEPISPEFIVRKVKTNSSGCVVTYVGLIRDRSQGKPVLSVEYEDTQRTAQAALEGIAAEIRRRWPVNRIAMCHRIGKLEVGDINIVFAIAAAHRAEGFAACQYAVDQFKAKLPTRKKETYRDSPI